MPKKILLLIPTMLESGGSQKIVSELGKLLSENHKVWICTFDKAECLPSYQNEVEILSFNLPIRTGYFHKFANYINRIKNLNRLIERLELDLVISNLWGADLVTSLSNNTVKKVSILHTNIVNNPSNRILEKWYIFTKLIYDKFNYMVAVNKYIVQERIRYFRAKKERVLQISNFVFFEKLIQLSNDKLDDYILSIYNNNLSHFVTTSRLDENKNILPLIEVVSRFNKEKKRISLTIIGDGEQKELLINYAKSKSLAVYVEGQQIYINSFEIIFLGFQPNPYKFYKYFQGFFLSSKTEGLPLVLIEALMLGLPIFSSDCPFGGPFELLQGSGIYSLKTRTQLEKTTIGYLLPIPNIEEEETILEWMAALTNYLSFPNHYNKKIIISRGMDYDIENISVKWEKFIHKIFVAKSVKL